jgi:hypothetical protein
MSQAWFYARDHEQQGPVSEEEFRAMVAAGLIREDTLIWRPGLAQWEPLRAVPDAPRPARAANQSGNVCACCGTAFPPDQLVELAGRPVCANCKPSALQRLEEGVGLPVRSSGRLLPVDPAALVAEIRARGYEVNIGVLLSRAWQLYRANFWPCVAVSTIVIVISNLAGLVPFLGSILSILLTGPLFAGLYIFFLKVVRGQPAQVSDAFAGFNPEFWRYMLTALVMMAPPLVAMVLVAVPAALLIAFAGMGGHDAIWYIVVPVIVLIAMFVAYFQIAMMFAIPLAADLQLGPLNAALVSLKAVNVHFWWVLLLIFILGIIIVTGLLGLIVGVFFTLPVGWLATMLLYEEIFAPRSAAAAGSLLQAT